MTGENASDVSITRCPQQVPFCLFRLQQEQEMREGPPQLSEQEGGLRDGDNVPPTLRLTTPRAGSEDVKEQTRTLVSPRWTRELENVFGQ